MIIEILDDKLGIQISTVTDNDHAVIKDESINLPLDKNNFYSHVNVRSRLTGEVNLTNWKFPPIKTLTVYSTEEDGDIMSIGGIEELNELKSFQTMRHRRGCLRTLKGFEFCHQLTSIEIQYQRVTDLSPIKELRLMALDIVGCPVESMKLIPYESLEFLRIDMDQMDLLVRENVILTPNLRCLAVLGPADAEDSRSMRQFLEHYPNIEYAYLGARRYTSDRDVMLSEHVMTFR